jgi:hypothetical protein
VGDTVVKAAVGEPADLRRTDLQRTTVTTKRNGAPGTGVHGVGLQASAPATKGTVTDAVPAATALSAPV